MHRRGGQRRQLPERGDFVLVKTLVNSGIRAPAMVPQEMMMASAHQSPGYLVALRSPRSM